MFWLYSLVFYVGISRYSDLVSLTSFSLLMNSCFIFVISWTRLSFIVPRSTVLSVRFWGFTGNIGTFIPRSTFTCGSVSWSGNSCTTGSDVGSVVGCDVGCTVDCDVGCAVGCDVGCMLDVMLAALLAVMLAALLTVMLAVLLAMMWLCCWL